LLLWRSASDRSALILPVYVPPEYIGKSAMSRGNEIIAAAFVAGSTLPTISVSVRAWVRRSLESIPRKRMLILESLVSGVENGVAIGRMATLLSDPTGGAETSASGSEVKIFEPAL